MSLIDTKSLLAKLMATENLHIEQKRCATAMFNVKTRVLTVPVLDKDVPGYTYDLFMGHEVGHALYTPMEGLLKAQKEDKIPHGILNVVEDSRIERKVKYKYPGLRNSFVSAYKDLYDQDFFGVADKNLNSMQFIDRLNLHQKVGAGLNIQFNDKERELIKDVESTETYDDVIEVSKKILDYIKQDTQEKLQEMEVEGKPEKIKVKITKNEGQALEEIEDFEFDGEVEVEFEDDGSGDGETEESGESGGGESDETGGTTETDETGGTTETDDAKSNDVASEPSETKDEGSSGSFLDKLKEAMAEAVRSQTDESYKSNESRLFDAKAGDHTYVNVPKFDIKSSVFPYKEFYKLYKEEYSGTYTRGILPTEYMRIRNESNKVVSYLVKEFELRKNADQQKRASISKTGELNMSKIYAYRLTDDIFKKMTTVPNGKSHGLVMFLDWSGSMTSHIENTVKQLISLVLFCKKVNIPYEVYAFADHTIDDYTGRQATRNDGDLCLNSLSLVNLLSSKMSAAEFTYASQALVHMAVKRPPAWFSMNGTPLNETIIAAMDIVPQFQKSCNVQIVNTIFLTDGESNTTSEYMSSYQKRYIAGKEGSSVVVRDPVTRYEDKYTIGKGVYWSIEFTKSLVKLLRYRTKSHVVGFYVIAGRDFGYTSYKWYGDRDERSQAETDFKRDKYCILDNSGFDEYYFLRSNNLNTDDAEFEVDESVTRRGLVSAFSKYAGSKVSSRMVLNRFIKMIS